MIQRMASVTCIPISTNRFPATVIHFTVWPIHVAQPPTDVDQVIANQDQANQAIGPFEEFLNPVSPAVPFALKVL